MEILINFFDVWEGIIEILIDCYFKNIIIMLLLLLSEKENEKRNVTWFNIVLCVISIAIFLFFVVLSVVCSYSVLLKCCFVIFRYQLVYVIILQKTWKWTRKPEPFVKFLYWKASVAEFCHVLCGYTCGCGYFPTRLVILSENVWLFFTRKCMSVVQLVY